jgi:hypothetical protein
MWIEWKIKRIPEEALPYKPSGRRYLGQQRK